MNMHQVKLIRTLVFSFLAFLDFNSEIIQRGKSEIDKASQLHTQKILNDTFEKFLFPALPTCIIHQT
jgi:hypothetical protein